MDDVGKMMHHSSNLLTYYQGVNILLLMTTEQCFISKNVMVYMINKFF